MIKVENIDIWGFEHAIRGMRNPKNSWEHSDTIFYPGFNDIFSKACPNCPHNDEDHCPVGEECPYNDIIIGPNDMKLMQTLFKGGTEHRKYLRQIFVSMDITAPLYWWKEFDTYKVGTVYNSCSTMHKIAAKEFELDDFSHEHLFDWGDSIGEKLIIDEGAYFIHGVTSDDGIKWLDGCIAIDLLHDTILALNSYRERFLETKDKRYWWQMIQLLPSSYNQRRTITMNYENVFTILRQRRGHKLDEWNTLCDIFETFPYVKEIGGLNETD